MSKMAISRQLAGHSIFRGDTLSRWDRFSVLTIEAFQTPPQMAVTASASSNFASA
jgi:hypothetical protein